MYAVIENAGYHREREVYRATSYREAASWLNGHYDDDDREDLHPDICRIDEDGNRSYDI